MTDSQTATPILLRTCKHWLDWLFRAALVIVACSIVSAHAPARIKLLGLFPVAVGCVMGVATAFVTKPHPPQTARMWVFVLLLMAFAGLAGSTWLAFRTDIAAKPKSGQQQLAAAMIRQMERDSGGQISSLPPESITNEFRWYLSRRVRQLGTWSSPWPELFWVCELLSGSIAAAVGWRIGVAQTRKGVNSEESAA